MIYTVSLPLSSVSLFRQKASAAAEMRPTEAAAAVWESLWCPPLERPEAVRLAQLLRRPSRLARHLLAS